MKLEDTNQNLIKGLREKTKEDEIGQHATLAALIFQYNDEQKKRTVQHHTILKHYSEKIDQSNTNSIQLGDKLHQKQEDSIVEFDEKMDQNLSKIVNTCGKVSEEIHQNFNQLNDDLQQTIDTNKKMYSGVRLIISVVVCVMASFLGLALAYIASEKLYFEDSRHKKLAIAQHQLEEATKTIGIYKGITETQQFMEKNNIKIDPKKKEVIIKNYKFVKKLGNNRLSVKL